MDRPHTIKPGKPGTMPATIIGVDCDLTATARHPGGSRWTEGITRWQMMAWETPANGGALMYTYHGFDPADCWRCLMRRASVSGKTLLVLCGAARKLAALGLWRVIEDGQLHLTHTDPANPRATRPDGKQPWDGWIIVDDPPTIITLRVPTTGALVQIVDCRNWGIDKDCWGPLIDDRLYGMMADVRSMAALANDQQWGAIHPTAGSMAWHTWRSKYYDGSIECHGNDEATALELAANYGGRCECGYVGKVNRRLYHLDFSALYPHTSCTVPYPISLHQHYPTDGTDCLADFGRGKGIIARVLVDITRPILPTVADGRIIYPIGRFRTVACGPELELVRRYGAILEIEEAATYNLGLPLAAFQSRLWSLRQEAKANGQRNLERLIKRMMVGLIGRFAMRDCRWVRDLDCPATRCFGAWWQSDGNGKLPVKYRSIGWRTERKEIGWYGRDCFTAITAYIASAARARLWQHIHAAGRNHCYYWDTDSLWVDEDGLDNLRAEGLFAAPGFGQLRIVDQHLTTQFDGVKAYVADGRRIGKGIPSGAVSLDGREARWTEHLRVQSQLEHQQDIGPIAVERKAHHCSTYRHGLVGIDGWVEPFHLREI